MFHNSPHRRTTRPNAVQIPCSPTTMFRHRRPNNTTQRLHRHNGPTHQLRQHTHRPSITYTQRRRRIQVRHIKLRKEPRILRHLTTRRTSQMRIHTRLVRVIRRQLHSQLQRQPIRRLQNTATPRQSTSRRLMPNTTTQARRPQIPKAQTRTRRHLLPRIPRGSTHRSSSNNDDPHQYRQLQRMRPSHRVPSIKQPTCRRSTHVPTLSRPMQRTIHHQLHRRQLFSHSL